MPKMYAMRRANGEFFTVQPGQLVAVWAGEEMLSRARVRNPELDLYRPVVIDSRISDKLKPIVGEKGFWLVESQTPDAKLDEGRRIDWTELSKLQSQQPPEPPPSLYPKVRATVQEIQIT
ncbi:MAG: hypothetical protein AB1489_11375 [Acidobacteriota bacterium]